MGLGTGQEAAKCCALQEVSGAENGELFTGSAGADVQGHGSNRGMNSM